MTEHEQRSEDEVLAEQEADAVEDLDVPEEQRADVSGGIINAWPKKYDAS
jgi:hypothetical protein